MAISTFLFSIAQYIDVRGRDLGMERTRRGRESARKVFERDLGVDRETPGYMMREEE
jgi:hypothetical protein